MTCKCGKPIEWTDWNYFEVPGYRTRENKCECKEPHFRAEPFSKEKKLLWEQFRPDPDAKPIDSKGESGKEK